MLFCNQQGIQNLPQSRLDSHSFKSRLIPSFLALSVITALYSPLQAAWVHNKPDGSSQNGNDLTISNGGTVNDKNWIFYTNNNSAGTLTINAKLTANASGGAGGGVSVSRNTRVNGITIGSNGGITVADNKKQSIRNEGTINNFTNSGTIDKGYMLNLGTINDFTNNGTINDFTNSESITNLTNTGTIGALYNQEGLITGTFNNQGTIKQLWLMNGHYNQESTISNLTNTGTIDSINLYYNRAKLTLNNQSGTIKTIENNGGNATLNGTNGTINTFQQNNGTSTLNNGTITTLNQNGGSTTINNNAKVSTLYNRGGNLTNQGGTISTLNNMNTITNQSGTITTLNNNGSGNVMNTGGTITTLNNNNANASVTNQSGTIATLTNTSGRVMNTGGTITMLNNTGGNVNNQGSIQTYTQEGGNTMQSGGTIQTLTQKGGNFTYQGGTIGSLKQEGGSFNNLQQNISLFTTQGGSLNNYQGTIENLKITSGDFELNNMQQGRIANIEIGGNGNININDNMNIGYHNGISTFRIASGATPTLNFGEVRTATTAQETYATVKLVDTNNANTTQAKVAIDKLTIALVSEDTQIGKSVSLANSVSGAANTGVGNVYVKSADFSQDLKQSGFYGKFNAQTQTIDTRFNANLGAAGLFSQAFINQLGRRSLLFDSFLNEASRASLRYKRTQPDTNFDIFVRPYYSKIKTDLADIPEKADGTSSGILAGGHTYFDNSLLMLYGAVEKNKTHLADDVFNFDSDTFLLGSKYSIELAQSHIGQLFGGVDIRGSYTKADLEREPVSGFKSQGDAKNYAYDARVFLASIIYYNLQDHSQYLTPQIGIGHTGAKLKGFDMKGNKLAYKESLDDMTYGITYATASLNWFKRKDNVAIQLDGGVRVNLNNEIDTQTKINNQNFTNHFETSKYYSQLGGAFMWINPYGVDVSLGYKFLFGESATSHTASLRLHKTF
ncbi:hypothetical protein LA342_02335 [Campylobacter upsaliensis]|uniref:hypothetical protein n=2 Tax=Campylobacter upsaliensis TaxID=28080 RepID=UPI001CE0E56F|nr:hypothetical protein [Campylobacter upsaliensis]MCA5588640.1 hypothetical protein [Campylobacter upsaliensis]